MPPPDAVKTGKVKAELRDGVLHLTIPKKAEMQSRRIEIGGKGAGGKELSAGQETKKEEAGKEGEKSEPAAKPAGSDSKTSPAASSTKESA